MFNNIIRIVLCTALIYLAGCAASNPGANTDKASYATKAIPVKFSMNSMSFLDDVRIYYHVQVYESNENTEPDNAELIFRIRPGSDKLYLKSRSLNIIANGKTFEWPGREWYDISYAPAINGTITTVKMGYEDLVTIAEATKVEGNLGGQNFDWPYKSREPMRQFIKHVNSVYQK